MVDLPKVKRVVTIELQTDGSLTAMIRLTCDHFVEVDHYLPEGTPVKCERCKNGNNK